MRSAVDLRHGLLHVAFAEVALARAKRFRDLGDRLLLADRDDRDARSRAARALGRASDSLDDIRADASVISVTLCRQPLAILSTTYGKPRIRGLGPA